MLFDNYLYDYWKYSNDSFYQSAYEDSNYGSNKLQEILVNNFGTNTLANLKTPIVIPSFEEDTSKYVVFSNFNDPAYFIGNTETIVNVCRASSAAPVYLPAHNFNGHYYSDGGVYANDAILAAINVGLSVKPHATRIVIIDVGTGIGNMSFDGSGGASTDLEHSDIKSYLEKITKKSSVKFIIIKDDLSHIFDINAALARNELVCFTGDRYFEGVKSFTSEFLGLPAIFPAGPFLIASRLNVPVVFVANHQSLYDIPPFIWFMRSNHPKFISKIELAKGIPSVSYNLRHGGAALIDRKNPRQSFSFAHFSCPGERPEACHYRNARIALSGSNTCLLSTFTALHTTTQFFWFEVANLWLESCTQNSKIIW